MAYTKSTWSSGDVVTSEKLNHLEEGVRDAHEVMFINDVSGGTLDKTWQEIYDAMAQGKLCVIRTGDVNYHINNPEDGFQFSMDIVTDIGFQPDRGYNIYVGSLEFLASSATGILNVVI